VAKAGERKKATEVVFERKLAREREAEDALYGDKEKFVTSAYAATLDERRVLAERDAREETTTAGGGGLAGKSGSFTPFFSAAILPVAPTANYLNGIGNSFDSDKICGSEMIANPKGSDEPTPFATEGLCRADGPSEASAMEPLPSPSNILPTPSLGGNTFLGSSQADIDEAKRRATKRFHVKKR